MTNESKVGYFCLGCAVGVAVAVILAPRSAAETVAYLREKANYGADYAKQRIDDARDAVNDVADRAKNAVGDQAGRLSALVEAGKRAYKS
jgi:gas vesicle protein